MKKLLSVIIVTLLCLGLCSCKAGIQEGDKVYKVLGDKLLAGIDTEAPDFVQVYSEKLGLGYIFYDEEELSEILYLFTQSEIKEPVGTDFRIADYTLTFYFGDTEIEVNYVGNTVEVKKPHDKFEYYTINNSGGMQERFDAMLSDAYGLNAEYIDVLKTEDVTVQLGKNKIENGVFRADIHIENRGSKSYSVRLTDCRVNTMLKLLSVTAVGCQPDSSVDYSYPVATELLSHFGINNIADVTYCVELLEYAPDGSETVAAKSGPVFCPIEGAAGADTEPLLGDPIKLAGVEIYPLFVPDGTYGSIYYYAKNTSESIAEVCVSQTEINGDVKVKDGYGAYAVTLAENGSSFAFSPVATYTIDEKENTYNPLEVEKIKASFTVSAGGKTESSELAELEIFHSEEQEN